MRRIIMWNLITLEGFFEIIEHDRHVEGLFSREFWLRALRDAGFEPGRVPFVHSELADEGDLFIARRPAP